MLVRRQSLTDEEPVSVAEQTAVCICYSKILPLGGTRAPPGIWVCSCASSERKKKDLFLHNYAMTVETLCPFSLHEDNDYYAGCFLKCLLASLLWWLYRSCSHRLWWWWASGTAGVSWWKCSTAALYLQSQPGECLRDHLKASASAWWCNRTQNPVFSHSVCTSGNH